MDVGNLISGSSASSKSSLNIWWFSVHILLKPSLENLGHYLASMWNKCNCVVVWTFFGTTFLWDWSENWPFPILGPLLNFKICWGNRLLEGPYKTLCTPELRWKEILPHKRPSQTCLWVSRSLWLRSVSTVTCCGVRNTEYNSPGRCSMLTKSFWRRLLLPPLPLPWSGLRPNYREGTQPLPSAENWIKDLLSMASPARARPSFPHSQSLPSGSFHKPLILIYQRADRVKTTITGN